MKLCLIVEDSRVIRRVSREIVTSLGFEADEAADGSLALAAVARRMPDVVLLDWNMPVMDGPTFLKAFRQLPGGDAPKVVFCTTESDLKKMQQVLADGADEFIMKPFDRDIVESKFTYLGLI